MNNVWLVAKWEFMKFFKWKQEVFGYLLMLGIYLAIFGVQVWQSSSTQKRFDIAIADPVAIELPKQYRLHPVDLPAEADAVYQLMEDNGYDGALRLTGERQYQLYVLQSAGWQAQLSNDLSQHHQQLLLTELDISEQQLQTLQNPLTLETLSQAEAELGQSVRVVALVASVLVAVALFSSFGLCLMSVTSEKMQRVTEQILTCIEPQQWIDGKTLGICLASIKSMITTTITIALVVLAIAVYQGEDGMQLDLNLTTVLLILLFILPGVVMWNYFFVGFAATIDDPNHSGKTGIMMIPAVPVMLVFMLLDDPGGEVATLLSIIPLTSISFMPMRLASMEVPVVQILISWALLIGTIYLMRLFATRVFAANVALYGKEPGWEQIWRAMLKPQRRA